MARKLDGNYITANTITTTQLTTTVVNQISAGGGPKVTTITYPNNQTAAVNTGNESIVLTGTGFEPNVQVYVNGSAVPSLSRTNANSLSFTTPALSTGTTYPLYVVNPDGGTAVVIPGMVVSAGPVWVTNSPLSSWSIASALSTTLQATSDSTVSYALAAGSSLPSGITLAANGLLSGTLTSPPGVDTTYNFTVVATDLESQKSSKAFSITGIIGQFIGISPSINGSSTIELTTGNLTIGNSGVWTITPQSTFAVNIAMWAAGGQTAINPAGSAGAGGYSHGTITFYSGNTYTIRVGRWDGGGNGPGNAGNGGGYTGVFSGTETFANSVIIAGGGGGGAINYNSVQNGGAGGGTTGQSGNGGGGTQSAGGAGGNVGSPALGASGGQLTGGAGANADLPGAGGGSGYYGGGGGGARSGGDGNSGGGGGGSGYLHPSLVTNGNTQTGSIGTAANSGSALRGTAGNVDANGKIIIQIAA